VRFDLYAELACQTGCPTDGPLPGALVSGFVDGCTAWSARGPQERNEARDRYRGRAASAALAVPDWLQLEPSFENLPEDDWLGLEVDFTLESPWYSKDDRPFHVLDNPVRKDRVFGVPYMSAASWKGLLRWSCRMEEGLLRHLEGGGTIDDRDDPTWILHLFGNEKGEGEDFQRGALAFFPTWFRRIGFEVINPHSRRTRAGTQPILYEVVPAGTQETLQLLYAPLPGAPARDRVQPEDAIDRLLVAIEALLTRYGISAKRTAGWGTARVDGCRVYRKGRRPLQESNLAALARALRSSSEPQESRND
jgi:CRISPR-associated protein Cmr2